MLLGCLPARGFFGGASEDFPDVQVRPLEYVVGRPMDPAMDPGMSVDHCASLARAQTTHGPYAVFALEYGTG